MPRYINMDSALQAHQEFLNEQIDDHDKAIYAKGWNACNRAYYDSIKELPFVSHDEVRGVGKWVQNDNGTWSCSECHSWIPDEQHYYARFCLFCGSKMEVSEDA